MAAPIEGERGVPPADESLEPTRLLAMCANHGCLTPHRPMARCGQCKVTRYCSEECAVTHWHEEHYKICEFTKYELGYYGADVRLLAASIQGLVGDVGRLLEKGADVSY